MKNVLVVAYYFPPFGYSGVQRILKFVKYLPLYGWQPTVVTITPHAFYAFDYSFFEEIKELSIDIWRTEPGGVFALMKGQKKMNHMRERLRRVLSDIGQLVYVPDTKIGWRKQVLDFLEHKDLSPFHAVLTTSPPFTAALIGLDIKRKYNLPLVSDFRDAWLDFPYRRYWTPWHRYRNAAMEKDAVLGSDAVVVTNTYMKTLLSTRYGCPDTIHTITQGFDRQDFETSAPIPEVECDSVTFVYSGVFYEDRHPLQLYRALALIRDKHPAMYRHMKFYMVGYVQEEYRKVADELGVNDRLVYCGYVEHPTAVAWLKAADVLWFNIGAKEKGHETVSPGKFFEYLGSGKPILGIVPENDIRALLLSLPHTYVVEPDNIEQLASRLLTLTDLARRGQLPKADTEAIEKFDRKMLTGDLSRILSSVAREP